MLDQLHSLWLWAIYQSEPTKFDHTFVDENSDTVWLDGVPLSVGDRVWVKERSFRPRRLWALLGMRPVTRADYPWWKTLYRVTSVGGAGKPWTVTRAGTQL